jgi:hypothetical protein
MAEIPPFAPGQLARIVDSLQSISKDAPAPKSRRQGQSGDDGEFSEYVLPRPQLHRAALHGVLREMVEAACANSEAVPSSVAIHILARFAATIGRTAYIQIGDQRRHLRMNALIVGPTSKGRKGTSSDMPRRLFELVEQQLGWWPLRQLTALATGEGLIHQVRDPYTSRNGDKETVDPGIVDKRLFCDVSEFAGVLAQARREGATISTVLRDAFDGQVLTTPTKTSYCQASGTHIVVVGSVPETEIVKCLSDTDKSNGFANRFPMFYSVRTKTVPMPEPTDPVLMQMFAAHVAAALHEALQVGHIGMIEDALELWPTLYTQIEAKDYPPVVASLLGRRSLYLLIFAALLALLNRERAIGPDHLSAADAWMEYWEATALFVFSTGEQNEHALRMQKLKDEIVEAIEGLGGVNVSHTAIANKVTNKYQKKYPNAKDVKEALELLQRESPPRIHSGTITTAGRPVSSYSLVGLASDASAD